MRRKLARAFWTVMLLAIAVFGARLLYVVQQSEIGWHTFAEDVCAASSLGFATLPPKPDYRRAADGLPQPTLIAVSYRPLGSKLATHNFTRPRQDPTSIQLRLRTLRRSRALNTAVALQLNRHYTPKPIATACLTLAFAFLCVGLLARLLRRRARENVSAGRPWANAVMLLAAGLSAFLFGLCPGGVISKETQENLLPVIVATLLAGSTIAWLLRHRLEQQGFRFSLAEVLGLFTVLGVMAAILQLDLPCLSAWCFWEYYIPMRGWDGIPAPVLFAAFAAQGTAKWCLLQWLAWHGPVVTVAAWLGLMTLVQERQPCTPTSVCVDQEHRWRQRMERAKAAAATYFASVQQPALIMASFALLGYLVVAAEVQLVVR